METLNIPLPPLNHNERELNLDEKKYRLKINLKTNNQVNEITFELYLISELSYYYYTGKCNNLHNLVKSLNINRQVYKDVIGIHKFLTNVKGYVLQNNNNNSKILNIDNKFKIILNKEKIEDQNIILIINAVQNLKEQVNRAIQNLKEQENRDIQNLKEQVNRINYQNGRDINLIYECENEGVQNIFGEYFAHNNEDNVELIINGVRTNLVPKYKLNKGENNIQLIIKNKLTSLRNMFNGCNTLKNIDDLKYLNTSYCIDFYGMFGGCKSLKDIKALQNWDTSSGKNFSFMFSNNLFLENIKFLEKWDVSNGNDFSGMFTDCSSLENLLPLENWNISKGAKIVRMFSDIKSQKYVKELLAKWNIPE